MRPFRIRGYCYARSPGYTLRTLRVQLHSKGMPAISRGLSVATPRSRTTINRPEPGGFADISYSRQTRQTFPSLLPTQSAILKAQCRRETQGPGLRPKAPDLLFQPRSMKLPNAENAVIERAKIVDYLLSETHFDGQHKATFFRRFGFVPERWQELAAALRNHVLQHDLAREEPSPFGRRLVVEGIMTTPDGRTPLVRSVWFLRTGESLPRFVSAYPLKARRPKEQ